MKSTVYIVDDEESELALMTAALEREGFLTAGFTRLGRAIWEAPAKQLLERTAKKIYDDIVGSHPRIQAVRDFVKRVASAPRASALLLGESGTGKNMVARVLHAASDASRFRFVEVNCAALPGHLVEAELFGYEKGVFSDVGETKKGLVEEAHKGTLLLDQVESLPPELQAKLLTFLESRTFRRLGSTQDRTVDLRVVAASNSDLHEEMDSGRFREDLYYRLNAARITLPPLREIRSDIPALTRHFLQRGAEYFAMPVPELDEGCLPALMEYDWPGNARELRNAAERALIFSRGDTVFVEPTVPAGVVGVPSLDSGGKRVGGADASVSPGHAGAGAASSEGEVVTLPRGLTLEEVERRYIRETLAEAGGSLSEAAERLGLTPEGLRDRQKELGLPEDAETRVEKTGDRREA
ncbi:MAG: sigma-54 dependent transcriptional regulator [Longimicrobiales bacterium]|nr:sigma-54 dependent transcriptional regulator [Longimicrobiales bacterium]